MTCAVYAINNILSHKYYVGSAMDVELRWRVHKSRLNKGNHHSRYLQRSWNKYGEDAFVFSIIEVVSDQKDLGKKEQLLACEQFWIGKLNSVGPHGYNTSPTASSSAGVIRSDEYRAKQSKARAGMKMKPHSEETKEKMSAAHRGRKHGPMSEEHKAKIGEKSRGRVPSLETRAKLRIAQKGRKHPILSEESRRKISEANKGRIMSVEFKEKVARGVTLWWKNNPERRLRRTGPSNHTPESRAKMSAAHKGRVRSKESIAKAAASLRGRKRTFTPEHCARIADGWRRWRERKQLNAGHGNIF